MSEQRSDPSLPADDRWLRRYRWAAIVTTAGVAFLTVAGGVVRLTDSGLGCADWPACNDERFIDVSSTHAAIEQINRLASGLIGLPTLLLLVAGLRARSRPGLRWPAVATFIAVIANAVVGGIAVQRDLHPAIVQSHFLLAMVAISFGMIAVLRSAQQPLRPPTLERPAARIAVLVAAATAASLATGTVVTGAGPHAGDEAARRFGFDISNVARTHSITVLATIAIVLWLAWTLSRTAPQSPLTGAVSAWLFLGVLQAVVGYVQYFNEVPELLVGLHIALATALWIVTMRLVVLAIAPTGDRSPRRSATGGRTEGEHEPKHGVLGEDTASV